MNQKEVTDIIYQMLGDDFGYLVGFNVDGIGSTQVKVNCDETTVKAFVRLAGKYRKAVLNNKQLPLPVQEAIKDIIWMARRYAEGRKTGAPELFNVAYSELKKYIDFDEANDPDNRTDDSRPIKNFPLATRGEYK
jgi:hypothetical protein